MTEFLALWLVRSFILGTVATALLLFTRRRSASVRHAAVVCTLVAMLALVPLGVSLPQRPAPLVASSVVRILIPAEERHAVPTPAHPAEVESLVEADRPTLPWRMWLPWIWLIGSAVLLLRVVAGFARLARLVRRSEALDEVEVPLLRSGEIGVPMTAWIGRHVVLVPASWKSWPEERRRSVLLHELAHVRRGDWLTYVLDRFTCALLWPNPLVWLLARKGRDLAERAADDLVLASGVLPSAYAHDLLHIARETKAKSTVPTLSVTGKSEVARRIEMILKPNHERGAVRTGSLATLGALLVLAAVPLSTWGRNGDHQQKSTGKKTTLNLSQSEPALFTAKFQIYRVMGGLNITAKSIQSDSNGLTAALTPKEAIKTAQQLSRKKAEIISSPALRMLDGQIATLTWSAQDKAERRIDLTLQGKSSGFLTNLKYERTLKTENSMNQSSNSWTGVIEPGGALLIVEKSKVSGQPDQVLLLRPSKFTVAKP